MIITRKQILQLGHFINKIKQENIKGNLNTKYKILKIGQLINQEFEISTILLDDIILKYAELNENLQPKINDNGGILIKSDKIAELQKDIEDFQKMEIQISDFYFSIDELEELELSFEELEYFMPFIKI